MIKKIFILTIMLLTFTSTSFACSCGCGDKKSFASSNKQKSCQNIFSLINIDLSILSPRASATDVNVKRPKCWMRRCCPPQPCCPQPCVQPCAPQCSPCKSMAPEDIQDEMDVSSKEGEIVPVANVQELKQLDSEQEAVVTKKRSLFRIGFFNPFKK